MTAPTQREWEIANATGCFYGAYENDGEDQRKVAHELAAYREELLAEFEKLATDMERRGNVSLAQKHIPAEYDRGAVLVTTADQLRLLADRIRRGEP